jgi:hypothetical protein
MIYVTKKVVCILMAVLLSDNIFAISNEVNFFPEPGLSTKVIIKANKVTVIMNNAVDRNINDLKIDAEKNLNLKIEDFNFDGNKDFSISYIDDGMGTYFIDRIFLYVRKDKSFVELVPKCGDEFINLKIIKKKKIISYTKFTDGKPIRCQLKFKQ